MFDLYRKVGEVGWVFVKRGSIEDARIFVSKWPGNYQLAFNHNGYLHAVNVL